MSSHRRPPLRLRPAIRPTKLVRANRLTGGSDTPALAGNNFRDMWRGRPVSDLVDYVKAAMPPGGRKPDDETLIAVVAYILHENDVLPGDTPLPAATEGNITWPSTNR